MAEARDWQKIRVEYESGDYSQSELERRNGVSRTAIKKRAIKEAWHKPEPRVPRFKQPATQKVQRRDVNAAERVAMAIELFKQRLTYDEIAKRCGYADRGSAYNAIQREMERRIVPNIDAYRQQELAILDAIHQKVWPLVMESPRPDLFAVDRLMAISKARRELLNLDIPANDTISGVTIIREYNVEVGKV